MPGGRPSPFQPEFVEQAQKLAKLGATDIEIADFFEVNVRTIYRWKAENEEFCQSLKAGKEAADERVERALFHRAIGYEQKTLKIFMDKQGAVVHAPYRERIAPDTTACIFWLKNRNPKAWRDKIDVNHAGSVTYVNSTIPRPKRDN